MCWTTWCPGRTSCRGSTSASSPQPPIRLEQSFTHFCLEGVIHFFCQKIFQFPRISSAFIIGQSTRKLRNEVMWINGRLFVWLKTCFATWQWLLSWIGNHHWFSIPNVCTHNLSLKISLEVFFVFSPGHSWEFDWWVPSTQFYPCSLSMFLESGSRLAGRQTWFTKI